jgi:hypothetical protein
MGGAGGAAQNGGVGGAGGTGVDALAAASIVNTGSLVGGMGGAGYGLSAEGRQGDGVSLAVGGRVINGSLTAGSALISGYLGVYAGAGGVATLTNFGTIRGSSGVSVRLMSAGDRLIVEGGAEFLGAVYCAGGALELKGGSDTIFSLGGLATLSGAAHLTFSGFRSVTVDSGTQMTLAGENAVGLGQVLYDRGGLTVRGELSNEGDVIVSSGAMLAVGGTLSGTGRMSLDGADATVLAGGATLTGGGVLWLGGSGRSRIEGESASTRLVNGDRIAGSGDLGGGQMRLENAAQGVIDANTMAVLTIDTGAARIINQGTIEATGAGTCAILGAVDNRGVLAAIAGRLMVEGAVTGGGTAVVQGGGVIDFDGYFDGAVRFVGPGQRETGELELARSTVYHGVISGFSRFGGTALDLRDIGFVSAGEARFSGAVTGGVLTVTDGVHTARIKLDGDYVGDSFVVSSDGLGGVLIVDQARSSAAPSAFVSAMAAMGAPASHADDHSLGAARPAGKLLAAPHV